jgi:hypothetical protein
MACPCSEPAEEKEAGFRQKPRGERVVRFSLRGRGIENFATGHRIPEQNRFAFGYRQPRRECS